MPETVFITGFPHLLARSLTRLALYRGPDHRALLLIEPQHQAIFDRFMEELGGEGAARVRPLYGAPLAPSLGLDEAAIAALTEVSRVLHGAHRRGPEAVRQNQAIFDAAFALTQGMPKLARFVLFSTAFVSGDRAGLIQEEELDMGQGFRTPYEQSLFLVEQSARRFMPHTPITVLRPSAMIGHSRTGESSQLNEGPRELLQLLKHHPTAWINHRRAIPFNIVPVDYVSRAAWELALAPEAESRTFHLTDPNPLNTHQAYELLRGLMRRIGERRADEGPLDRLRRWLGPSTGINLSQAVTYSCAGALELLASAGVDCPSFESYADLLIAWLARYEARF
ncbi:SDR family oxidoreductase [Myxococcota bacterium]|nr:SDR family oxidoreductase [Myxococcota bacterium]MBU1429885.1 SDR family oxidoreductase [Myxococcota bacterium]MBU1897390.1 SDR family oxidoreductase [Myxococcota bacterium]